MLYSDNSIQNAAEVADNLSKCSIKEMGKPPIDRTSGAPAARLAQNVQGLINFVPFIDCNLNGIHEGCYILCIHFRSSLSSYIFGYKCIRRSLFLS